jgi:hypothetical protein
MEEITDENLVRLLQYRYVGSVISCPRRAEPEQGVGLEGVRLRSTNQNNNSQVHLAYRSYGIHRL